METKIILQGDLARYLLKKGYQIIDIKPKRENPQSTVFVFKVEKGFFEELDNWKK